MDKTTPQNKGILRNFRKCSQNSNMDSNFDICACCNYKKTIENQIKPLTILQILSISVFEQRLISRAITPIDYKNKIASGHIQLNLFDS